MSQSTPPDSGSAVSPSGGRADEVLGLFHRWSQQPTGKKGRGERLLLLLLDKHHLWEEEKGRGKDRSCPYQVSISFPLFVHVSPQFGLCHLHGLRPGDFVQGRLLIPFISGFSDLYSAFFSFNFISNFPHGHRFITIIIYPLNSLWPYWKNFYCEVKHIFKDRMNIGVCV